MPPSEYSLVFKVSKTKNYLLFDFLTIAALGTIPVEGWEHDRHDDLVVLLN
jgi:hypothetical protein